MARLLLCAVMLMLPATLAARSARVATPTFSLQGGEYSTVITVTVRVNTPGAVIRFTMNGLDPTEFDPVIVSGSTLAINTSLTLKARAWKAGLRPSAVHKATYTMVRGLTPPLALPVGPGDAAAGWAHAVLALPDGRVHVLGPRARPVESLIGIRRVAMHADRALAVTWDGLVYSWDTARTQPDLIDGLKDVVEVAAGRAHFLALTADGRVYAWGQNHHGQLGTGSRRARLRPTEVAGLTDVTAVAAGAMHSAAITSAGELYVWGGNATAQLGDGSRRDRLRPVRLDLPDVAEVAAGDAHTLARRVDGSVYAWGFGRQGQLGTGSQRTAVRPVRVTDLSAWAIAAGGHSSAAVRRDGSLVMWGANESGQLGDGTRRRRTRPGVVAGPTGISTLAIGARHAVAVTAAGEVWTWGGGIRGELAPAVLLTGIPDWGPPFGAPVELNAPLIEPPTATYTSAQTVTISTLDPDVVIRYTVDGSEPTSGSPAYSGPFVVSSAAIVTARSFATAGAAASPATSVTLTFYYGVLPPPTATPDGGPFMESPVVSLASIPGATIRYTIDGSLPHEASPVFVHPVAMPPDGGVLQAQAFHVDWAPSALLVESYTIDNTAPAIDIDVSPALRPGWMTEPVVVSFRCEDDSGTVFCPAPIRVETDGADQIISGTARDEAGNQSTASITVSVDLSPPVVVISLNDDGTTAEETLTFAGTVADAGSGVAAILCHGEPVPVASGGVNCTVGLRPGVNHLTLHAVDAVGHNASAGLTITRVGVSSSITLSPAERAMLVQEVGTLSLRDDFGAVVERAVWTSSDTNVVQLSESDPPRLTAMTPGRATITAVKDELVAEAAVTVYPGVELPAGTTRWTLAPAAGVMEPPIYTHRVDPSVPDLFTVETTTWGSATLRAVSADGEVWGQQHSPGMPLMGDAFGGVVAGVLYDLDQGDDFRAYVRLGRAGGVAPWRYESPGALLKPAQAADGTIYAVEYLLGKVAFDQSEIWDKYFVAIDGRTGRLFQRVFLGREVDRFVTQNPQLPQCRHKHAEWAPDTVGPIAGGDGRGYLLVRRYHRTRTASCTEPTHVRPDRVIDVGVDMVILSPTAPPATDTVSAHRCEQPLGGVVVCDAPANPVQILADGLGGILAIATRITKVAGAVATREADIVRWAADGTRQAWIDDQRTSISLVGQAGMALVFTTAGVRSMNVTTWTPHWSRQLFDLAAVAPLPDGSLAVQQVSTNEIRTLDPTGQLQPGRAPLGLAEGTAVHEFGQWMGLRAGWLTAVAGRLDDATRWSFQGNRQGQQRARLPGFGIWLKTHNAIGAVAVQHTSLRITPFDQDWLLANRRLFESCPSDHDSGECRFLGKDVFDNLFFTMGAGLGAADTSVECQGTLIKGYLRPKDVSAPPAVRMRELPLDPLLQNLWIRSLMRHFEGYQDNLPYHCFPETFHGFYNSNSFTRGLLDASRVPHDGTPPTRLTPGWNTPVPVEYFPPK
jgi:hypothetical protein